jgi:hypothetical protein
MIGTVSTAPVAADTGSALLGRITFVAGFLVWLFTAVAVGRDSLTLDTPHGLWASVLYESLLVLLAVAASVPHRPTERHVGQVPAALQPGITTVQ